MSLFAILAEEAAMVVKQMNGMLRRVRRYDRASHTISIGSSVAVQIPDSRFLVQGERSNHRP